MFNLPCGLHCCELHLDRPYQHTRTIGQSCQQSNKKHVPTYTHINKGLLDSGASVIFRLIIANLFITNEITKVSQSRPFSRKYNQNTFYNFCFPADEGAVGGSSGAQLLNKATGGGGVDKHNNIPVDKQLFSEDQEVEEVVVDESLFDIENLEDLNLEDEADEMD